ncbi:MAG: hypothetical protein U0821_12220 [Chloroflexota bacterium]
MTRTILSAAAALMLSLSPFLATGALAEQVLGAALADIEDPGTLAPIGHGRFSTQDRVYSGRAFGRSGPDEIADCFTGPFRSTEDWQLEAPKMTGSHLSTVTIRSERGSITLRLRGQMEFPAAAGRWDLVRGTGSCVGLDGEGRYSATYLNGASATEPELRLTFEGTVKN